MSRGSRYIATACAAVVSLGITACSAPPDDGPLGRVDDPGRVTVCADHEAGTVWAVGGHYVTNDSDGPVTIESVDLARASGVEVVGARVSLDGQVDLGMARDWPTGPSEGPESTTATDLRRTTEAVGAVIEPDPALAVPVLVGLRMDRAARADGLTLTYRDGMGRRYRWVGTTTIVSGDPRCTDLPERQE